MGLPRLGPTPTLQQQLSRSRTDLTEKCISPRDLKSIRAISDDIRPKSRILPPECTLGDTPYRARHWQAVCFTWTAAASCSKPAYFDEEQLERYGHSARPLVQPFLSAAHFFVTVPLLPYYMGVDPPCECQYTLGYYRPDDCAPLRARSVPAERPRGVLRVGVLAALPLAL